jgi:predicted AAA+ superfamily ATPase
MYIERNINKVLIEWGSQEIRKPLLIRGARQVGKSSSVRELSQQFDHYIEVDFESQLEVHAFFQGNLDPEIICENLSIYFKTPIITGKTLLFFDEIQACIPAISSLRYFYEKLPQIHLIAAGSLLEFALQELPSFGVGRIRSIFVYPFSFDEFLNSLGESQLVKLKKEANDRKPLPDPFHKKLIEYFKKFLIIGGMPEVVANYAKNRDLLAAQEILDDITISLKSDFSKYKKRVPTLRISEVFESVVSQNGGKFKFANAATNSSLLQIKESVNLLILAGLIIPVTHTSANGIPLGAEADYKRQKLILLDTGLYQRILGLNVGQLLANNDFDSINKGAIAEMVVGLEWLKYCSPTQSESLYYWHREKINANAELDYVFQAGESVLPIEVKSSNKGAMQSLFQFLKEKKSKRGIRISLENFSSYDSIEVYPLYAISTLKESLKK